MPLQPPAPAVPGQLYWLFYNFTDYESGVLTDPISVQLDLTYGTSVDLGADDIAGPFVYTGASSPAPNTVYRIAAGQYGFVWQVPGTMVPGVYVANWTSVYGAADDSFLTIEDFPIAGGGPFTTVPAGDTGFWTGTLTYQPAWADSPFVIPFGQVDSNGIAWQWQSIQGWDSPPSAGAGVVQRSADQGGWPTPQFYGPRIVTLTIMASAPSQELRDYARAILQQAVPVNDLAVLQYDEPVPKIAYVRRNAQAGVTEVCSTLTDVVFTIPLVCPDPRKYAPTPQSLSLVVPPPVVNPLAFPLSFPVSFPGNIPPSATTVTALNVGTFETRPTITVTGPVTNPAIINATTGQQVSFTGLTLQGTDQLVLDMDNRQSYLDGNFYAADVQSAWWVLNPGPTQVYLDGVTTGGATLSLTFSSAWI
jgi:hypothetical protein